MKTRPLALVAEDTELGRWALAHALQANGYEVYMSANWTETDGWLDRADFDVAVVSVSWHRDDVSQIARHLRDDHASTGLILLALHDDTRAVRTACGPAPVVLSKPFEVAQVVLAAKSLTAARDVAKGA